MASPHCNPTMRRRSLFHDGRPTTNFSGLSTFIQALKIYRVLYEFLRTNLGALSRIREEINANGCCSRSGVLLLLNSDPSQQSISTTQRALVPTARLPLTSKASCCALRHQLRQDHNHWYDVRIFVEDSVSGSTAFEGTRSVMLAMSRTTHVTRATIRYWRARLTAYCLMDGA